MNDSRVKDVSRADSRGYSIYSGQRDRRDRSRSRGRRNSSRRGRFDDNPFIRPSQDEHDRHRPAELSEGRDQRPNQAGGVERPTQYEFPTNPLGSFAQAMSSIACNAEAGAKGVFNLVSQGDDSFLEHVSQAFAQS